MSVESIDYSYDEPLPPAPGTEAVTIAAADMIGVGVPFGVERVSRVALQALRSGEAVVSYLTEDVRQNSGRPLCIRRRPQA